MKINLTNTDLEVLESVVELSKLYSVAIPETNRKARKVTKDVVAGIKLILKKHDIRKSKSY